MKEFLFSLLKGASVLEAVTLLNKLKEADTTNFSADLIGGYTLFKRLSKIAEKTKTKIDDTVADIWLTAIEQVAETNGVTLPTL